MGGKKELFVSSTQSNSFHLETVYLKFIKCVVNACLCPPLPQGGTEKILSHQAAPRREPANETVLCSAVKLWQQTHT